MSLRTNQVRAVDTQFEWSTWVLGSALLLIALSVVHSLQSFAQGFPARFGLILVEAAILFAVGYAAHIVFILLAAAENVMGYIGNLIFGVLWLLLVALMHLGTPAYASGLGARSLEVGVILAALILSVSSIMAWRSVRETGGVTA